MAGTIQTIFRNAILGLRTVGGLFHSTPDYDRISGMLEEVRDRDDAIILETIVRVYTLDTCFHSLLNDFLRSVRIDELDIVGERDREIGRYLSPFIELLHRALSSPCRSQQNMRKDLWEFHTIYRGLELCLDQLEYLRKSENIPIDTDSFTSTSYSLEIAHRFSAIRKGNSIMRIRIHIDDSWNVSYFSALMQEQEVLLPPGIPLLVL
jgi:hypothetical protein